MHREQYGKQQERKVAPETVTRERKGESTVKNSEMMTYQKTGNCMLTEKHAKVMISNYR